MNIKTQESCMMIIQTVSRACSKALKYSILRKDSFMNKKITEEGNEGNYI